MRVFVSGPISGKANHNKDAFCHAAYIIRQRGYIAIIPHEVKPYKPQYTWRDYMRACISALCPADRVVFLPGWWRSKGALTERVLCCILGIQRDKELEKLVRR